MAVTFQEHRLGSLTSLGAQVALAATYTINIWVKNVTLPGQEWANLFQQTSGWKYVLDANYGAIGTGAAPRLAAGASSPLQVADTWHLVSAVYNGSTMEYYVNGTSIGSITPANPPSVIDVLNGPAGQEFAAEVKDMRVYSGVATAGEILASFDAGDGILAPAPATVNLSVLQTDSYGDTWNGGSVTISDANGTVIQTFLGPAQDVKLPAGLTETVDVEGGTYTYTVAPGGFPGENACTITDEYGTVLANLVGTSGTGTFDVSLPSPVITPTLTTSAGEITISATLNAEAIAAGATDWAYSLSALGAEGQPHGGTLVALGVDATVTPATHEVHTVYLAAVDASGNVIVANSDTIDNSPTISVTIVKSDSYDDSWDGTFLVITHDGTGTELYNATLAGGASPLTVLVDLPYGTYSWALVGGDWINEHSVVITLTSDGTELANSAASVPSSGSFTVESPVAAAAAAYQWDHGGELTHIKHFSAGYSVIGADAYGYTKEEPSDNTTTLYFASDFKTFSTFTEYTAASTGIEGSPSCLTYGTNNLWLLGTSAGKVYEITLLSVDSSTAFFDERWSNATGEAINAMKFDANTGRWIFETEDSLYTMDQGGANVQSQLSLAAGEKIVDIQSGEGHIVYVVRKADYSFELFVCDSSWANIKDSASMQPILASHEAIDVNYSADSDLWTASSASGVVISTDDLSNWLI